MTIVWTSIRLCNVNFWPKSKQSKYWIRNVTLHEDLKVRVSFSASGKTITFTFRSLWETFLRISFVAVFVVSKGLTESNWYKTLRNSVLLVKKISQKKYELLLRDNDYLFGERKEYFAFCWVFSLYIPILI